MAVNTNLRVIETLTPVKIHTQQSIIKPTIGIAQGSPHSVTLFSTLLEDVVAMTTFKWKQDFLQLMENEDEGENPEEKGGATIFVDDIAVIMSPRTPPEINEELILRLESNINTLGLELSAGNNKNGLIWAGPYDHNMDHIDLEERKEFTYLGVEITTNPKTWYERKLGEEIAKRMITPWRNSQNIP